MYVREKHWHGLGVCVEEAPASSEALKLAGLNWEVNSENIFSGDGSVIQGYHANVRSSDNKILGVVSDRYSIIQNHEAFAFTDSLVGEGLRYETAGSLRGGKLIWLLGKMPERKILEDKFEPYICFTNAHDGSGAVRCCMTPIRVVCNNTLNLALDTAMRSWSTNHVGNLKFKMEEARATLGLANCYLDRLDEMADQLANEAMSEDEMHAAVEKLVPESEDMGDRQKQNVEKMRDGIIACVFAPDLVKYLNTKWAFVNGVADYVDHSAPFRLTDTWKENRWKNVMSGHALLDRALSIVS